MADDGGSTTPEDAVLGEAPDDADAPGWLVARQSIHEALFPDVGASQVRVGRFELQRRLGSGGMGEVYVAYDEQLDRQVALKVLRREYSTDERARERLLREAQVLARLSHPHVVQVYEAGIHDDQVYLVMELVDGVTLREWLEQTPEGAQVRWAEVLPVMIAAGRGLAAAHAAGLTHRDFKPENVLVGHDGRVRVLDFGLARPGEEHDAADSGPMSLDDPTAVSLRMSGSSSGEASGGAKAERSASSGSRRGIAHLTEPGRVVGTLAYMSPEQLAARPVDARSDQYSFCVTLYEALFGERPFKGRSKAAYVMAVSLGPDAVIPRRSRVPRWLRGLVRQGLSLEPERRFADMETLLHELSRPRGRVLWAGVAASAVGLGLWGYAAAVAPVEEPPCAIEASELDGTWDDARREGLRSAFAARGVADAAGTVEGALDRWSEAWLGGLRAACEATRVAGTQSEAMLDRRSGCLERQRREAGGVVELLTDPAQAEVAYALELLSQLPDAAVCADPRLAEQAHPLPEDPARREAVLAAYEDLGRARALAISGRFEEAEAIVDRLQIDAAGLGHMPLAIELEWLAAERARWRGRVDEAVTLLRGAVRRAEIEGLDELSATLRYTLADLVVHRWGRHELQEAFVEEARTALARLDRPEDPRALRLELADATLQRIQGDYEGALTRYRELIGRARELGDLELLWSAQRRLGQSLLQHGALADAEQAFIEARDRFEERWGPSPTIEGEVEQQLGLIALQRGDLPAAQAHFDRAREILEPLVEADSPAFAALHVQEAKLAFLRGDLERAGEGFSWVVAHDGNEDHLGNAWEALGVLRFYQGDMNGSLEAYRQARVHYLVFLGPEHPTLGILESNIGESLAALGDHHGALQAFMRALEILEASLPSEHLDLALPLKGRGQSRRALGDVAGARVDLERALALHRANVGEPVEHADVELSLARLLYDEGQHARALELARSAEARLLTLGHEALAREASAWLREHE